MPLRRSVPVAVTFAIALLAALPRPSAAVLGPCLAGDPSVARVADVTLSPLQGLTQPVPTPGNVAGASFLLGTGSWAEARIDLAFWDPTALAPDPTTVALRSRTFTLSDVVNMLSLDAPFVPPVVTDQVAHVADPLERPLALTLTSTNPSLASLIVGYAPDGPGAIPVGYRFAGTGPLAPLGPGSHPVAAHTVCSGNPDIAALRVGQAVMRTDVPIGMNEHELLQRFRVPAPLSLAWVELALGATIHAGNGIVYMAIYDGLALPSPTAELPTPLVESWTTLPATGHMWAPTFDATAGILLQPEHDYWLMVQTGHLYPVYARTRDGSESADFTAGIGPLYSRATPGGTWGAVANEALCFRLLGTPTTAIGAPAPPPRANPLRLSVSPNPARGWASVQWSGARGGMMLEVFDVRGRRLGVAARPETGAGRWAWPGTLADGRTLDAGVYLLRATDASGATAERRVVLLR